MIFIEIEIISCVKKVAKQLLLSVFSMSAFSHSHKYTDNIFDSMESILMGLVNIFFVCRSKMSRDGLKSKLKYPEMNEVKKYSW